MESLDLKLANLIGKDEKLAQHAAIYLVESADVELFKMLVEKTDFLFDFVRHNICSRIEKAVNKNNYMNILKFFDYYSMYYDDLFAEILSKHANQSLTDIIFELLEKGNIAQKTYSAKYFSIIPDTISLEILSKYAFSEDENLAFNSAEALGQMQDDISYDIALDILETGDDFEKLKAVKFFTAYGKNYPFEIIFKSLKNSKMPENIAGQIPYMESLLLLYENYNKLDVLSAIDSILSGLGEILSLSDIFQFELYDVLEFLIMQNQKDNEYSSRIAKILLSALSKFNLFCENQEYIFDEDKNTKNEIISIRNLLIKQNNEFWNEQKHLVLKELTESDDRILSALTVIAEYNLSEGVELINNLLKSSNEIIVCEALTTLKALNALENINIEDILLNIKNSNIKAIIENL